MLKSFRHTKAASRLGYVTQSAVSNFVPLPFLLFRQTFGLCAGAFDDVGTGLAFALIFPVLFVILSACFGRNQKSERENENRFSRFFPLLAKFIRFFLLEKTKTV